MVALSDFFFYPDYYGLYLAVLEIPEYIRNEPVHPDGFLGEVRTYCSFEWRDVQYLCLLAIVWGIFRELLVRCVLKVSVCSLLLLEDIIRDNFVGIF